MNATKRRYCLRDLIPEILQAASFLDAAVTAHLEGHDDRARDLIARANLPSVREWTESIWGKKRHYAPSGPYSGPPRVSVANGGRLPNSALQSELHLRDGYYCRFCGIPVIRRRVRERLRTLFPDARIWGRKNAEQHAALQCLWAQYDHVLPMSRGGANELGNLLVTCAPCRSEQAYRAPGGRAVSLGHFGTGWVHLIAVTLTAERVDPTSVG